MKPEQPAGTTPGTNSHRTSRSLLERARNNQPEAWQRLVLLYDPLVRYWCRRGGVALSSGYSSCSSPLVLKAIR